MKASTTISPAADAAPWCAGWRTPSWKSLDFFVNKTGTDDIELRIVETEVASDKLTNIKTVASVIVSNADVTADNGATNVVFETPVELEGGKTYAFLLIPQGDAANTYSVPLNNDTTMLKVYCGGNGQAWSTGGGLHPFKLYVETDKAVTQPAESVKTETTDPDDPNKDLVSAEDPIPDDQVDEDLEGSKPYFKTDGTLDYTFTPSAWGADRLQHRRAPRPDHRGDRVHHRHQCGHPSPTDRRYVRHRARPAEYHPV